MDLRSAAVANGLVAALPGERRTWLRAALLGTALAAMTLLGLARPSAVAGRAITGQPGTGQPGVEATWTGPPATPAFAIPTARMHTPNEDPAYVEAPAAEPTGRDALALETLRTSTEPPATAPVAIARSIPPTPPAAPEAARVLQPPATAPAEASVAPVAVRPDPPTGPALNAREAGLAQGMNNARRAAGLPALVLDGGLTSAARMRSQDMVTGRYFAHVSPTGSSWLTLLNALNIPIRSGGENLAKVTGNESTSVSIAMRALMDSPTHRANILGRDFTSVGVAAVTDDTGMTIFTTIFAAR
ncbi:MAG: CAP domain-containing protein [Dehalococcoidia bacterium]